MNTIDRRTLVKAILIGGAAAGLAFMPDAAQAAMPFDEHVPRGQSDLIAAALDCGASGAATSRR